MVVIDTLRATTTIAAIFLHGGQRVRPVEELEEAWKILADEPSVILGGERNNRRPQGFHAGNSPLDFPSDLVRGRSVVLTTTNGTQALARCRQAAWVVSGALVNASVVGQALWTAPFSHVLIVCAGAHGADALEDVLAAGAIVTEWPQSCQTDSSRIAHTIFHHFQSNLYDGLLASRHGAELQAQGWDEDLRFAARLNACPVLPVLGTDGWIRLE